MHYTIHSVIGVPRIFTMEGVHMVGAGPGSLGDGSPPLWSRGKAPVGDMDDFLYQKQKQINVFL